MGINNSRFKFLRCMCCGSEYGYQLGRLIPQCNCSENNCRRCGRCEKCCECISGFLIERRPKKFRCFDCSEHIQGSEKFCPHCGISLK